MRPGDRFGRLVLLERFGGERVVWRCRCDCGRETLARADKLQQGRKQSCGCLLAERNTAAHEDKESRKILRMYKCEIAIGLRKLKAELADRIQQFVVGLPDPLNFEYEGTPQGAAKELESWAFMIGEVLNSLAGKTKIVVRSEINSEGRTWVIDLRNTQS